MREALRVGTRPREELTDALVPRERGRKGVAPALKGGRGAWLGENWGERDRGGKRRGRLQKEKREPSQRDRTDGPTCPADAKGRHTAVGLRPLCTPWHEAEFKENHL